MASPNHNLKHRPLRAGVAVYNPLVNEIGAIGLIGTDAAGERWIISCYHVLCRRDLALASDGEPIYQPIDDQANLIARTSTARASRTFDCAAARVLPEIKVSGEILALPRVNGIQQPMIGMRVLKSGCVSGVTEGIITEVLGDKIEIRLCDFHPCDSILSEPGDSGALWVSRENVKAVALHQEGTATGGLRAKAIRLTRVLDELQLQPLFE
jgi:hypothetical protein